MGKVNLSFEPRNSLLDFSNETSKISLLRLVKGFPKTKNMAIRGENLAALAALKSGAGISGDNIQVDIIYIDPPYNVGGNQGYKNTWKGISEKERDWAGDHGAFLDFMEPRLKIGRSLLKDEGVMFVSICDGEYCRLKILMDEIFGESNCIGTLVWDKSQGANSKHLTVSHEYVLVYAKNKSLAPGLMREKSGAKYLLDKAKELKDKKVPYAKAQAEFKSYVSKLLKDGIIGTGESPYKQLHPKTYQVFRAVSLRAQDNPERRCQKKLLHPVTNKKCPLPKNGWSLSESTLINRSEHQDYFVGDTFVIAGQIVYGLDEENVPQGYYPLEDKTFQPTMTVLKSTYGGDSDLPDGIKFSTPKPVEFVKDLIKLIKNKDAVILDYFGGSGATAHAVEKLNAEDGGNRTWIMIEEMNSTFNLVMLERFKHYFIPGSFSIYELQTATVQDKELMKVFSKYSKEFISAYHFLETDVEKSEQGISIIGWDSRSKCVVAMVNNVQRSGKGSFEKELKLLKDTIREKLGKKVLIYTINDGKNDVIEEPWRGVGREIFHGTTCNDLKVVEIPEQLIKEWNEVLQAMVA